MPKNNSKTPTRSNGQSFTFTDPTAGKNYNMTQGTGLASFSGDYGTSAGIQDMRINLPSMPEGSGVSTSVDDTTITGGTDYRTEAQKVRQKMRAERVQKRQELRNKKQAARIEKRTRRFEDPEGYKADKKAERETKKKARKQKRLDKKEARLNEQQKKIDAKKQELNSTTEESPNNFLGNTLAGMGGIVAGGVTGTGTQPATQALQRRGGMLANLAAQTQAAQAEQQGSASSVMPTGGGKFQLTPVAMKTYDPPMQANEKGGAVPQFNSAVRASANYLYGTPAQRQASVGSMFQLSEAQMEKFGPGGSHENPGLLKAIKDAEKK